MPTSNLTAQALPAVDNLLQQEEDDLYIELANRLKAMQQDPTLSASFAPDLGPQLRPLGVTDDIIQFGESFFKRLNLQAYELVCGNDQGDKEARQEIINAFGVGKEAVAAAMAAFFVANLGLAPAIAAVVAALVIKLFFKSAHGAMCDLWKSKFSTDN